MPLYGPEVLLYEKKDRIVTMTLNRPERLNALSSELAVRIAQGLERFRDEEDAWVLIITGAGERAFSAGADLLEMSERFQKGEWQRPRPETYYKTGLGVWKPVIAAINGYALAGGFRLAQICDLRIAAQTAEFGIPEPRWNLSAGWVCDLTRIIGMGHALELILRADVRISAQRAYEIGFVNKVVPEGKALEEARAWAEGMLSLAPRSVRNLKEIIYRGYHLSTENGNAFGQSLEHNLNGMEDSVEGPKAFAERRQPNFKNR